MENLKNVAPIEDFNWDAYENGEAVTSASHEELEKAYDGAKLAVRATHTPLAEGDYVHSNTSDDNVWAFSYPEVESTRDPLLNTAPVAYDFNK